MKRNCKKKFLVCSMALAMGLASLGSVGTEAWAAKKPKLSKTTASMEAGKKLVLKVKNKLSGSSYKWITSNKKVATVSSKGVVKAVKAGNVTITCKVKKKKKTYTLRCNITVEEKAVPTEPAVPESSAEPAVNPAEGPTEEPVTSPAEEPTAGSAEGPTAEPMVTPAEEPTAEPAESPTTEPMVTPAVKPTEEPAIAPAAGKNSEDVAAIRAIIAGQKAVGATVSEDLDDAEQYTWSDGRLVEIDWADQKLKGTLDVSDCRALTKLICVMNELTGLEVSNNAALRTLWCGENQLEELDVSKNAALFSLSCYANSLTRLDVSGNMALAELYCSYNQLRQLDVSANTALIELDCKGNRLTELNVTNCTKLEMLEADASVAVTGYGR